MSPKQPIEPHPLDHTEIALRQSIEIIQKTITDLCLRRDTLVAALPNTPRQKMPTHFMGKLIKATGPVKRKRRE